MINPIAAYNMVSLAFLVLLASPAEVMYWTPPYMITIIATSPNTATIVLTILPTAWSGSSTVVPGQPRPALISSLTCGLLQMVSSAENAIWTGMSV